MTNNLAPEQEKVIDWRLLLLCRVFGEANATRIAEDTDMDYRYAIKLRQDCDDEKLCMRILYGKP